MPIRKLNPARIYALTLGLLSFVAALAILIHSHPVDLNALVERGRDRFASSAQPQPAVELTSAVAPLPPATPVVSPPAPAGAGAGSAARQPAAAQPPAQPAAQHPPRSTPQPKAQSKPKPRPAAQPSVAPARPPVQQPAARPAQHLLDDPRVTAAIERMATLSGSEFTPGGRLGGRDLPGLIPEENLRQQREFARQTEVEVIDEVAPAADELTVPLQTQFVAARSELRQTPSADSAVAVAGRQLVILPGLRVKTYGRYRQWTLIRDQHSNWQGWIETRKLDVQPLRPPGRAPMRGR